jgi:hypothetical protein
MNLFIVVTSEIQGDNVDDCRGMKGSGAILLESSIDESKWANTSLGKQTDQVVFMLHGLRNAVNVAPRSIERLLPVM